MGVSVSDENVAILVSLNYTCIRDMHAFELLGHSHSTMGARRRSPGVVWRTGRRFADGCQ